MKRRRIHIVLAAFSLGILLWFSVSMSYQYHATVTAPLVIYGVPEGMAIKGELPRTVQLKFREDGWRLAAVLARKDLKCILHYSTLPGTPRVLTVGDISERMNLPLGVQPVSMKPESLHVVLDAYAWKKVPVVPDYTLRCREGYGQVGLPSVRPESVALGGAESVLRTLTAWRTVSQVLDNVRTPIDVNVPLSDSLAHILSLAPAEVRLHIDIQQVAEKMFAALPIEVSSIPPNREVFLNPPRVDLIVRGGVDRLATLTAADFKATIDYRAILADAGGTIDIGIVIPSGVQVVTKRPERVEYIIRKRSYPGTGE